ncbi:MAG: hypothetical protein ACOYXA_05475 [Bacteroidota bacterium]
MKRISMLWVALLLFGCEVMVVEPIADPRDEVVGWYEVEEYSETYNVYTDYAIRITKAGNGSDVYLHNFYGIELRVIGEVRNNKIFIPWQLVEGYEVEGIGTIQGTGIRFHFNVTDRYSDGPTDFCEAEAWLDW